MGFVKVVESMGCEGCFLLQEVKEVGLNTRGQTRCRGLDYPTVVKRELLVCGKEGIVWKWVGEGG